ncbi:MAG TPA: F0F1 ATP synthase subunit B [Dehalococcoidia bacterium]|nr:F0F1 ATP synthase subunit B [Dehalococcoidia bacterium]
MVVLGITDLGINLPVLVAQTVNFVALLILLRVFVYKPILNMLDERKRKIAEGLSAAEQSRQREIEAARIAQEQIDASRREGQAIVQQAQQVAQRLQEEARQSAQQQAEALLLRARNEIQLERDNAIAELRREFADLAISAAEKVVGQALDRNAHQRLIQEALAQSSFRDSGSAN